MAAILVYLVEDPDFSFDPRYYIFLVFGGGIILNSLYRLVTRKYTFERGTWRVASVALAGYTLVYWALYLSGPASLIMEAIVITSGASLVIAKRTVLTRNYGKGRFRVIGVVILAVALPSVVFLNATNRPDVVVSPSATNVTLEAPGSSNTQNALVGSTFADAWNIVLTSSISSEANKTLTVYLNDSIGPLEIPFLQRGRQVPFAIRIESSPLSSNGTRDVELNSQFQDLIGHQYSSSVVIHVMIGSTSSGLTKLPIITYSIFGIVGFIIVITAAILLRRLQSQKRPPNNL